MLLASSDETRDGKELQFDPAREAGPGGTGQKGEICGGRQWQESLDPAGSGRPQADAPSRPGDALARYVSETFLNFSLSWQLVHGRWVNGVLDASAPERIPSRIGLTNLTGSRAVVP